MPQSTGVKVEGSIASNLIKKVKVQMKGKTYLIMDVTNVIKETDNTYTIIVED